MCFLSFVPAGNDTFVISHNRDENIHRQHNTLKVNQEIVNGRTITMPVDAGAGGTWIGTDGMMTAALLNGYKTKHSRQLSYIKSRGSIIPQLLNIGDIGLFTKKIDFIDLEPFTLVVFDLDKNLWEIGWNGSNLFKTNLDPTQIHTYSSCTLYDQNIASNRHSHFVSQISSESNHQEILAFHSLSGEDINEFVNVSLTEDLKTVAICQIIIGEETQFKYVSLVHDEEISSMILR